MPITSRRSFCKTCLTAAAAAPAAAWSNVLGRQPAGSSDTAPTAGSRLKALGRIVPRTAIAIAASPLGVGFETLDRRMFDPERTYAHLAQLGAKWARCQTGWGRTETKPGVYDFGWLDGVVDSLRRIGVQPWFNLGYGNQLYTPDAAHPSAVGWVPIFKPEAREAWVRYTRAIAEHFRDRVTHWEIWNECNSVNFWQPQKPSPADYLDLVKLTVPVITNRIRKAVIVGGAFAGVATEFFRQCMELGLGEHVHKISYHPYRPVPEAKYDADVGQLREITRQHRPGIELWQGENGCPSQDDSDGALAKYHWTEARQAKWLTRRILSDLRLKLELTSYFHTVDMLNYVTSKGPTTKTNFKGLLRGTDYTAKPSFFAYQCLCALFDAQTVRAELPIEFPAAEAEKIVSAGFLRQGKVLYAYWLPADLNDQVPVRPIEITLAVSKDAALTEPVLVDPLTAAIHQLPVARQEGGAWKVTAPLADYPLLIGDRGAAS